MTSKLRIFIVNVFGRLTGTLLNIMLYSTLFAEMTWSELSTSYAKSKSPKRCVADFSTIKLSKSYKANINVWCPVTSPESLMQ